MKQVEVDNVVFLKPEPRTPLGTVRRMVADVQKALPCHKVVLLEGVDVVLAPQTGTAEVDALRARVEELERLLDAIGAEPNETNAEPQAETDLDGNAYARPEPSAGPYDGLS